MCKPNTHSLPCTRTHMVYTKPLSYKNVLTQLSSMISSSSSRAVHVDEVASLETSESVN